MAGGQRWSATRGRHRRARDGTDAVAVELLARGSPKGLGVCSRRGFSVVVAPQTPTRLRVSTAAPGKVSDCVRGAAERESRARDARSAGGVGCEGSAAGGYHRVGQDSKRATVDALEALVRLAPLGKVDPLHPEPLVPLEAPRRTAENEVDAAPDRKVGRALPGHAEPPAPALEQRLKVHLELQVAQKVVARRAGPMRGAARIGGARSPATAQQGALAGARGTQSARGAARAP